MLEFTPEKLKKIALARLDLLNQWKEFRRKSENKLQADYDFVNLHNTSNSNLFQILGKISRGSLHRWYSMLNDTEDYTKLIPQYKYAKVDEYRTILTNEEIKIFMGLLLHPNRICIGKAIALTKYKLQQQGQSFIPTDATFRRYANWYKNNNYDKWILARDGEKALSDKVEPYIKRDASLLEVGDILVADGHKLAFQEQISRLLDSCYKEYPDVYPILYISLSSGASIPELLGLTWDRIDFRNQIIFLKYFLYGDKLVMTKCNSTMRRLTIDWNICEDLEYKYHISDPEHNDFVFKFESNKPAQQYIEEDVLAPLAKEVGVSKLNPSDMQHNFVNMCIQQNIPLTFIQKSLGYYGITNFVKVYRNLIENLEKDYYNPLEKILKK